jgi:hypothetical protein
MESAGILYKILWDLEYWCFCGKKMKSGLLWFALQLITN